MKIEAGKEGGRRGVRRAMRRRKLLLLLMVTKATAADETLRQRSESGGEKNAGELQHACKRNKWGEWANDLISYIHIHIYMNEAWRC